MLMADISHLFQCWQNFVKWNFRLCKCAWNVLNKLRHTSRNFLTHFANANFSDKEIYNNFSKGLCPNPKEGWFEGQIGFIEKYAISLATRSQIFFDQEFSNQLLSNTKANLDLWKNYGAEASLIMAKGVEDAEAESKVLESLYDLCAHSISSSTISC
jgi:hypothetical protein